MPYQDAPRSGAQTYERKEAVKSGKIILAKDGRANVVKEGERLVGWWNWLIPTFKNLGASEKVAQYIALLAMHETNGFKSRLSQQDNNYSGIKFVKQPGATQGRKSPEGNYYAKYPDRTAWAADLYRILANGKGKPLQAVSLEDFAQRLKAGGYYTDSVENYTKGLQRWAKMQKQYKTAEHAVKNPKYVSPEPQTDPEDLEAFIKKWWKWILGGVIIFRLTR